MGYTWVVNYKLKRGHLNRSVDIRYSIAAFNMSLLVVKLELGLPYRKVSINWSSSRDKIFSLMFLILFKRVCVGEWKLGQRRKKCAIVSVTLPESHNVFRVSWKQCLNLWSQRWLNPGRNFIRSLIPYELRILKILFAQGRIKFSRLFLKSVQMRSFFWSVFGHFLRSVRGFPSF